MEKKRIEGFPHVKYHRPKLTGNEMVSRSEAFYQEMEQRRTVREFDSTPIPVEVLENIIKTANTAPSGAHKQPWTFCLISDSELKTKIRKAAEEEEKTSYASRMSATWKEDLKPLGTTWEKPFLEEAPFLIVVFKQSYGMKNGEKIQHYYVNESVGIACGMLLSAIHKAGLVAVTHTPSPMNFLSKLLKRPAHEKPYLLIPVGYAKAETYVPDIQRKPLEDILIRF
ncbi:nitroreductase family protein [Algoriphagus halophytocola]|uniref:Nitroreductase family protein n=1 Tax=Algoriphagus halophytocola TaxID=2991499 RepID=A0ABY6MFN1_9BACT|nr:MULTISPECIES: nitroreductase family protein [unclassified Algoriphagus]UZD21760.1 nitroreductase family protein [Algoriphagus sp. TR-M5]WBL42972.1 nitroreductase family protein [Algoriphagus sp. TR-M9]